MTGLQAILLAGGQGTRLRPVVPNLPKPMAPVGGRPFLEYLVLQLIHAGVRDLIMSVGYRAEHIRDYFGDGSRWGASIRYVVEKEPLGTGGALRAAMGMATGQTVLAMNGDSFFALDLPAFLHFHRTSRALFSLALARMADTGRYGRVEVDGRGEVVAFQEKQGGNPGLVNAGVYLLHPEVSRHFPAGSRFSVEEDVLPGLVGKGLWALPMAGFFVDIGVPEDYRFLCSNSSLLLAGEGGGRG